MGRGSSRQMQTCREATVLHYAPAWTPTCRGSPSWLTLVFCILRLHWRRQARLVETGPMASRAMDLQVAKDILDFV